MLARNVPQRCPKRRGEINPLYLLAIASIALLVGLIFLLPSRRVADQDRLTGQLFLYCAAAMRRPIEAAADEYRDEFGVNVQIQYGGSNTLLNQLTVGRVGDLFLSADERYLDLAKERGLVDKIVSLARMQAVIGVPRGNPRGIQALDDLLQPGIRVVLANPDQAAIGSVTRDVLSDSGHWQPLEEHTRTHGVFKPTVGDVANDIALRSADAGILWDAVANQYPEIAIVHVPELSPGVAHIAIGVLEFTQNKQMAERFIRYLTSRDGGLRFFREFGFQTVDSESPANKSTSDESP